MSVDEDIYHQSSERAAKYWLQPQTTDFDATASPSPPPSPPENRDLFVLANCICARRVFVLFALSNPKPISK